MAYSNKRIPDDPTLFPEPQTWVTWVADLDYDFKDGKRRAYPRDVGSIRHHYTLADARKNLMWIGSRSKYKGYYDNIEGGRFMTNWAVYHWDSDLGEWVLAFSGACGEARDDNPLFKRNGSWKEAENGKTFAQMVDSKLEDKALESILSAARKAS